MDETEICRFCNRNHTKLIKITSEIEISYEYCIGTKLLDIPFVNICAMCKNLLEQFEDFKRLVVNNEMLLSRIPATNDVDPIGDVSDPDVQEIKMPLTVVDITGEPESPPTKRIKFLTKVQKVNPAGLPKLPVISKVESIKDLQEVMRKPRTVQQDKLFFSTVKISSPGKVKPLVEHKDKSKIQPVILRPVKAKVESKAETKVSLKSYTFNALAYRSELTQKLVKHMRMNGLRDIIKHYQVNGTLTPKHKETLMLCAANFALDHYGIHMLEFKNLQELGKEIARLFRKVFTSEEALITVDNGILYEAIKNRRDLEWPDEQDEPEHQIMQPLLVYLQQATMKDMDSIETIKRNLRTTFAYRRNLWLQKTERYLKKLTFKIFWIKPVELVSFEFDLLYPDKRDNLLKMWQKIVKIIDFAPITQDYPVEVKQFLAILKIIGTQDEEFTVACSRLVEFHSEATDFNEIVLHTENTEPFVLAKFRGKQHNVTQYFLVINRIVVQLQRRWTFVDAFDLIYKIHHIFNIPYAESLSKFFKFFEEFVFETKRYPEIKENSEIFDQILEAMHGPE